MTSEVLIYVGFIFTVLEHTVFTYSLGFKVYNVLRFSRGGRSRLLCWSFCRSFCVAFAFRVNIDDRPVTSSHIDSSWAGKSTPPTNIFAQPYETARERKAQHLIHWRSYDLY